VTPYAQHPPDSDGFLTGIPGSLGPGRSLRALRDLPFRHRILVPYSIGRTLIPSAHARLCVFFDVRAGERFV